MNKNVLVVALIAVMLVIAGFLVYGIITHTSAPKVQAQAAEPKAHASAAGLVIEIGD